MKRRCSRCQRPVPGYDQLEERTWQHVLLWGIAVRFRYAPRRVECPEHGVVGELRTRVYEKEYGNRKKFTVKQHVCEIALQSILKLDRAARAQEPAPDVDPSELPAEPETGAATVPSEDVPY